MNPSLQLVIAKLGGARRTGACWMARCPVHDDGTASLSITEGRSQPVIFTCHAGCERDAVLAKLGLTWEQVCNPRDEQPQRGEWTPHGPAIAVYRYEDEHGKHLFDVLRAPGKKFIQRRPDRAAKSGWCYRLDSTRRVLYHLPKLLKDLAGGAEVWIPEGEKDVNAIEARGYTATCNPHGAGKWRDEYAQVLEGAVVHIVADRDEQGQRHARQVFASLQGIAAAVEIVEPAGEGLPDGGQIKDASDHFAAGYTMADFVVTRSEDGEAPDLAPDLHEFIAQEDEPYDWIVPQILERKAKLFLTGIEGGGKSELTRMLLVAVAAGLHPFRRALLARPFKGLLIDLENDDREIREGLRRLEHTARLIHPRGASVPPGNLRIICKPEGLNVLDGDGAAWLKERITAHRPDVVYIGSFYKMHETDMNDERAARLITVLLDQIRTRHNCAVITEAHCTHEHLGGERSMRPIGSSLLRRWPQLGFGLRPTPDSQVTESGHYATMNVVAWRPPRGAAYRWPRQLTRGGGASDWPWVPVEQDRHLRAVPAQAAGGDDAWTPTRVLGGDVE